MKKLLLALALCFTLTAYGQSFPAGPNPPAPDVMNGTPAERQAYVDLVLDYLNDWANYYVLQDYTTFQNQDPSNRVLTIAQVTEMIKVLQDYQEVLSVCRED